MATDDSAPHIPGYRILNLIGRGANATVYLALQESLNRHVALKILQKFDRPAQAVRFFNEGQIVASMNHPNIITIYDIGSVGSQQYIAMEHLDGGSLKDRIREGLSPADALDIVQSIGSALEFVHQMGIVHRDIKPENILFHKRGMPKITDFGVAKALDRDMNLTMDGTALGSPYYLSPEQAEGKDLDGRSDIYSLGVILFEMLAGHKPYLGESQIEVIFCHLNKPIPSLPEEHRQYQGLVEKMMAKNASDRFSSAQEMLEYLSGLRNLSDRGGHGTARNNQQRPRPVPSPAAGGGMSFLRNHPWLASLAALALAGAGAAFLLPPSPSTAPETAKPAAETAGLAKTNDRQPDMSATGTPVPADTATIAESADQPGLEDSAMPAVSGLTAPAAEAVAETTVTDIQKAETEGRSEAETLAASDTLQAAALSEDSKAGATTDNSPADQPIQETTVEQPAGSEDSAEQDGDRKDISLQVEELLSKADTALKKYRLTSPRDRSAYHYYREALKLDPGNRKAARGIRRIADRYHTLAKKALEKGDEAKSRAFIKRGLSLNPRNRKLLAMQQQLDELEAARLAPPPPPEPVEPPPPPPKPKPVNNGLQLLDSLE